MTTKVGLLTFEGDAGLASETATFNGRALTDALNPVEQRDELDDRVRRHAPSRRRRPNYANQLGMDLDVFANLGALANNQTSASLAFSSTNEYFMPSAFFLVSDEGPATSSVPPSVAPPAAAARRTTARR